MAVFGSTGTSLGTYSSSSNAAKTTGLWRSNGNSSSASKSNSRTGSTCPTCGKSLASAYYTGTSRTNATCSTCGKTSGNSNASGRATYVPPSYMR